MKLLLSVAAITAAVVFAGPVSAQMYQPMRPAPTPWETPAWMQDDGSSSDYPTSMPSDRSADALNAQYRDGVTVPYGTGFPAPYYIPR